MGVRIRSGQWHYRFTVDGHEYTGATDLAGTSRNKSAALRMEAEARKLVIEGRAQELRIVSKPFSDASMDFLKWADSEHRDKPHTARRLHVSFSSLDLFFGKRPVGSLNAGDVERYKAHRRTEHKVKEITLRHDLHALSKAFGYWKRCGWTRVNPVADVEIPSDRDAVRIHVLTEAEERKYFEYAAAHYPDLCDFARLVLQTGARPYVDLAPARKEHVDLVAGIWRIPDSKSTAGRREIPLTTEALMIFARRMVTNGPWIFPSPKTPGDHWQTFQRSHDLTLEKTGLRFTVYDLRHTCATRWAEAGMALPILAALLGHADLRTLKRYVHVRPEAQRAAIKAYDSFTRGTETSVEKESIN